MPHLSTHATLYSALRLVVPLGIKNVGWLQFHFRFHFTILTNHETKTNWLGFIRSTARCISRCGKHGDQAAMRAEPLYVGGAHVITSMFCQLRVSGSLTVLWNPKLGSTHQFTSRGPLDQSGSWGVEQAILYHTREARLVILAIITVIQSEILVVVTGWKDVILNEWKFSGVAASCPEPNM